MKTFISLIFFIFSVTLLSAQEITSVNMPVDENTGLITYKEVVEEPGTKDELFNRGASWLPTFYANPWEVTKVRDQSTGLIKIQHQFRIYDTDANGVKTDAGMILYNAKLEFKDNRYRVVMDDFVLKEISRFPVEKWLDVSAPEYNAKWKNYLSQIDTFSKDLIESFKAAMKPKKEAADDDW